MYEILAREFIENGKDVNICHASTILKVEDDVLCAWFGGSVEGADDVNIWMNRRTKSGWGESFLVAQSDLPCWNPVFFQHEDGNISLFYKVGREISSWKTMVLLSTDGGLTFGQSRELVEGDEGGRGPVRNKPIVLNNGYVLAPASSENGIWKAFVDISTDGGYSFTKSCDIEIENLSYIKGERTTLDNNIPVSEQSFFGRGVIQPSLWQCHNGDVHMLLRSSEGKIYKSDSTDNGTTWSYAYATNLDNNNSGLDLVSLDNGVLVLCCNPVNSNWGQRSPISLFSSIDNGKSWTKLMDLDSGKGEFSYPAIVGYGDEVYISYTWKRKYIAFWKIHFFEGGGFSGE